MVAIYAIECIPTKFVYVGCTKYDLAKRCREHMSLLKHGKHSSALMTQHYAEHGRQAFVARVLEDLPHDIDLPGKRERELSWMAVFRAEGRIYNENEASFGVGTKPEGFKMSPESNLKRRLAQLGKPKKWGQGLRISATKKALGQKPSREAYLKSRESRARNLEAKKVMR